MYYAIKIGDKYFKDYVYASKGDVEHRYGRARVGEGDIIDIVLTDKPERTEVRSSLGNTIGILYRQDFMRDKKAEIIPILREDD